MPKRTEDQMVMQSGEKCFLGDKEVTIKPLTMRKAFAWRESLSPLITKILEKKGATATPDSLRAAILDSPQEMVDAIVTYLGYTEEEKNEMLDNATEDQIQRVFYAIMHLAFRPLIGQRSLAEFMMEPEKTEARVEKLEAAKQLLSQSEPPSRLH